MKIALLSDTHNNILTLSRAIQWIEQQKISTLIHCGDLTTIETGALLRQFRVILTFGNGDFTSGALHDHFHTMNNQSYAGMHFEGEIHGSRIAITHGHIPGKVEAWTHEQRFEYIFTGHTHRRRDERKGITRIINPGALGGLRKESRSFAIIDLQSGDLQWINID
jgi:putative phosphoesterase